MGSSRSRQNLRVITSEHPGNLWGNFRCTPHLPCTIAEGLEDVKSLHPDSSIKLKWVVGLRKSLAARWGRRQSRTLHHRQEAAVWKRTRSVYKNIHLLYLIPLSGSLRASRIHVIVRGGYPSFLQILELLKAFKSIQVQGGVTVSVFNHKYTATSLPALPLATYSCRMFLAVTTWSAFFSAESFPFQDFSLGQLIPSNMSFITDDVMFR